MLPARYCRCSEDNPLPLRNCWKSFGLTSVPARMGWDIFIYTERGAAFFYAVVGQRVIILEIWLIFKHQTLFCNWDAMTILDLGFDACDRGIDVYVKAATLVTPIFNTDSYLHYIQSTFQIILMQVSHIAVISFLLSLMSLS